MSARKNESRGGALPSQFDLAVHENTPGNADECDLTLARTHHNLCGHGRDDSNVMEWENDNGDFSDSAGEPSLVHGGQERKAVATGLPWEDPSASLTLARKHDESEWRPCTYSHSKNCNALRIRKSNGKLHRFCKFHADRAKVHQRRSVEKKKSCAGVAQNGSVQRPRARYHYQVRASASITRQVLQCVSSMPPHVQRALLDAHGFRPLDAGAVLNASVDDSSRRLLAHPSEGLDKLKSRAPVVVLVDNLTVGEVQMLRPYIPSWFWEFVDEAHASLG